MVVRSRSGMIIEGLDLAAEVRDQVGAHGDVDPGDGGEEAGDLVGTGGESGPVPVNIDGRVGLEHLLSLELLEVADGELKDVGLLKLGDGFSLMLESMYHEILEVVQALVDPCPPLPLQQGFHDLPVLVRPGHGDLVDVGDVGRGRKGRQLHVVVVLLLWL